MQPTPMNATARPADAGPDPLPFDGRPPSPDATRAEALARFENDRAFFERIVPLFRQAAFDQSASGLARVAFQISTSPSPPGRVDAK